MRVHELAKELQITSQEILARMLELRMPTAHRLAALTDEQERRLRESFAPAETEPAATEGDSPAPEEQASEQSTQESDTVVVGSHIVVRALAEHLNLKPNQLIAELMTMNIFASLNEKVEFKIAQQIAARHGVQIQQERKPTPPPPKPAKPRRTELEADVDRPEDMLPRPPIVTFLGHVDHGKTSLLDRIRRSKVATGEDGGITQHIGAYTVEYRDKLITFLDTPGHEAFTAMRAHGAQLTDIAVLVIAADDGIMPQTREAIQHARAANVCIMVAINKIDLKTASVDRVKRQLQSEGLTPDDWGGQTICCPVSALTGEGLDNLLDMILLQTEMLELKASARRRAQGYVIEARLASGMGPTANLLVRRGTLKVGDAILCGAYWGKVKALINDKGIKVRSAGPSIPVQCLGLINVPEPGDEFLVQPSDKVARELSEQRQAERRRATLAPTPRRRSLEDLLRPKQDEEERHELALILKADVQGSLEAIQHALQSIKSEKVSLRILLFGVGNVTENDVLLAGASQALILGFQVSKEERAAASAKRAGVEIRLYSVIYELLDAARDAMTGLLEPIVRETVLGHAEIRQVFEISKKGNVAGCMVVDGRISARSRVRVRRGSDTLFEGTLSSLKRFQNDVAEVREGQECGIRIENFTDFEVNDILEVYEVEKIAQQL